ncbi:hypothetical protein LEP1GSC060_1899 [Leptospira weilii serovar Ranarum str. ICFT]|uniref:Uncharacterized protein n=1 Tax=Leptospira weilii serovar Ranarum str. ICFT TaxID=1218598 RepID=N1WJQ6_9LEPT|nr:hypothetical protein LEP1GSC060_1899 [Leptospira weilii serovar Ranarum str. ICFT]
MSEGPDKKAAENYTLRNYDFIIYKNLSNFLPDPPTKSRSQNW